MSGDAQSGGFACSAVDGVTVVTTPVEIEMANFADFTRVLGEAGSLSGTVIVDMSDNEYCDSSGISALVMAYKAALADGGEVRLVMGSPAVRRVFKVTGADRVFRIFDSVPDAIAAVPAEAG
jgi:anti-sigma B factor antagonist